MSDFTLPIKKHSAWDESEIREFLLTAVIPMRLAMNDANGFPRLCSLWFGFDGQAIIAATHQKAFIAGLLENDGRCAFEIGSNTAPYQGVRGQAVASLDIEQGKQVLPELMDKYIGNRHPDLEDWLKSRMDEEYAIRLELEWISAWDYSDRML